MRSLGSLQHSAIRGLAIAGLLLAAVGNVHADSAELMLTIESPEPDAVIGELLELRGLIQ